MSHSTLKSIKMKALITFLFFIFFNAFCGQTQTTSPTPATGGGEPSTISTIGPQDGQQTTRRASPSEGNSETIDRNFNTIEQCRESGCECCLTGGNSESRGRVYCNTESSQLSNIQDIWGQLESRTISGKTIRFYNFSGDEIQKLTEVINILPTAPDNFLEAIPENIVKKRLPRVGGGSRRCGNNNQDCILIHPDVFTRRREDVRLTFLHEAGHFVDWTYDLTRRFSGIEQINGRPFSYRDSVRVYLHSQDCGENHNERCYSGHTTGNGEVAAQAIMTYLFRKNFRPQNARYYVDRVRADRYSSRKPHAHSMPPWMLSLMRQYFGVQER